MECRLSLHSIGHPARRHAARALSHFVQYGPALFYFVALIWRPPANMIRLFNHYLSVRTLLLAAIEAMVLFQSVLVRRIPSLFGG